MCCSPRALGIWFKKDCKGTVDGWVYTKCCKKFGKSSDYRV